MRQGKDEEREERRASEPFAKQGEPQEIGVALVGVGDESFARALAAFEALAERGLRPRVMWASGVEAGDRLWVQAKESHPLVKGAKVEDSIEPALRDPKTRVVFFSARSAALRPQELLRATSAGLHVFCPSPWAQGLLERAKLEGALQNAARWGLALVCDHARRADPGYKSVKSSWSEWGARLGGIDRVEIQFAAERPGAGFALPLMREKLTEQADLLGWLDPRMGQEASWMSKELDEPDAFVVEAGAGSLSAGLSGRRFESGEERLEETLRLSGPKGALKLWMERGEGAWVAPGERDPASPDRAKAGARVSFPPLDPARRSSEFRQSFMLAASKRTTEPEAVPSIEDLRRGSFLLCHLIDFPDETARWRPSAQLAPSPARRASSWTARPREPLPLGGWRALEAAERDKAALTAAARGEPDQSAEDAPVILPPAGAMEPAGSGAGPLNGPQARRSGLGM
jgi:predicted dehydrogenase